MFDCLQLSFCKTLGRGAFGEVFLVMSESSDYFALKKTPLEHLSNEGVQRAQAEAQLQQRLGEEHECILRCFDCRTMREPARLELLLEYAPLGDLNRRIQMCRDPTRHGRGVPEVEATVYATDIASGLAYMHSLRPKIFHRDVKPANVVLFPSGCAKPRARAKLADFGISKILECEGSFAKAQTVIGTPHYFSPEMWCGEEYDERSDAWALGCVIYEMICLRRPFHRSESNLAALCFKVTQGDYDKDALTLQAKNYNGLFVLTLMELLVRDPTQRRTPLDVQKALEELQDVANGSWPILEVETPKHTLHENSPGGGCSTDSWRGGAPVVLEETLTTKLPVELTREPFTSNSEASFYGSPMTEIIEDNGGTCGSTAAGPSRYAWPRPATPGGTGGPLPEKRSTATRLFVRALPGANSGDVPVVLCFDSNEVQEVSADERDGWLRVDLSHKEVLPVKGIFSLTSLE